MRACMGRRVSVVLASAVSLREHRSLDRQVMPGRASPVA